MTALGEEIILLNHTSDKTGMPQYFQSERGRDWPAKHAQVQVHKVSIVISDDQRLVAFKGASTQEIRHHTMIDLYGWVT